MLKNAVHHQHFFKTLFGRGLKFKVQSQVQGQAGTIHDLPAGR
jgi:hypothetical protein